jgi:hypothetical protein
MKKHSSLFDPFTNFVTLAPDLIRLSRNIVATSIVLFTPSFFKVVFTLAKVGDKNAS